MKSLESLCAAAWKARQVFLTGQFIFCTCSPRRQPRDNAGQVTFSFDNRSPLASPLQAQQKVGGFLPSARGKTQGAATQLRRLAIRWMQKGPFAVPCPSLQRFVVFSSIYMSSAVLTRPSNFHYGSQKDIHGEGHCSIWVPDCCYTKSGLCFLCLPLSCCSALVCWLCPFEGRREAGKGWTSQQNLAGILFLYNYK